MLNNHAKLAFGVITTVNAIFFVLNLGMMTEGIKMDWLRFERNIPEIKSNKKDIEILKHENYILQQKMQFLCDQRPGCAYKSVARKF